MKEESPLIGYTQLLHFDDEAFVEQVRQEELQKMRAEGRVWKKGDPVGSLSPELRRFVESRNGVQNGHDLPVQDAQDAFCVGL